jgi:hypothetical protein
MPSSGMWRCIDLVVHQQFGGRYCLHLQGRKIHDSVEGTKHNFATCIFHGSETLECGLLGCDICCHQIQNKIPEDREKVQRNFGKNLLHCTAS